MLVLGTQMKAEILLGGRTRFLTIDALADAKQPITAYQIAMIKGLDPAATYRCLTELLEFRIVESQIKERNQTFYKLSNVAGRAASNFLRSLKQERSRPVDLEKWMSTEMQTERMEKIVKLDQLDRSKFRNVDEKQNIDKIMSKRVQGELAVLVRSAEIAFSELFELQDGTFILKT